MDPIEKSSVNRVNRDLTTVNRHTVNLKMHTDSISIKGDPDESPFSPRLCDNSIFQDQSDSIIPFKRPLNPVGKISNYSSQESEAIVLGNANMIYGIKEPPICELHSSLAFKKNKINLVNSGYGTKKDKEKEKNKKRKFDSTNITSNNITDT